MPWPSPFSSWSLLSHGPPTLLTALWARLPLAVDPCAHDHGGCSPHANCTTVAPGQRTCTCLDGYTGDGELCQGEAGGPHQARCRLGVGSGFSQARTGWGGTRECGC